MASPPPPPPQLPPCRGTTTACSAPRRLRRTTTCSPPTPGPRRRHRRPRETTTSSRGSGVHRRRRGARRRGGRRGDLLTAFGRSPSEEKRKPREDRMGSAGFDDLIPGFAGSSSPLRRRYGPFWTCTTLIFVVASIATFVTYLSHKWHKKEWNYDINLVTQYAALFYGYVTFVPLLLYVILKYF